MSDLITGILITAGLAWVGWISITVVSLSKSSSVQEAVKMSNSQAVEDLKKSFIEMENRVTDSLDKMNRRQDDFCKAEIQELKNLLGER